MVAKVLSGEGEGPRACVCRSASQAAADAALARGEPLMAETTAPGAGAGPGEDHPGRRTATAGASCDRDEQVTVPQPWIWNSSPAGPLDPGTTRQVTPPAASARRPDAGYPTGFQLYNGVTTHTVGANQDYYLWAAQPNQYMCVAVRAYNSSGYSAWAGMWTCVTTPAGGIPAAPTNVAATPYSTSAIEITFVNQANNQTGFYINNGGTTGVVNSPSEPAKGQSVAVLWTGLAPDTYMCFKVAAYNQWGSSAYVPSSWACATSKSLWPTDWANSSFCSSYGARYTGETYQGVAACGNAYPNNPQEYISYKGVELDSDGFQCVELAARYFYYVTGKAPPLPADGSQFADSLAGSQYGYSVYPVGAGNGTSTFQSSITDGNIISMWSASDSVGHVGVVTNVSISGGKRTITVMDENGNGSGTDTITVNNGTMSDLYGYTYFQWTTNLPTP